MWQNVWLQKKTFELEDMKRTLHFFLKIPRDSRLHSIVQKLNDLGQSWHMLAVIFANITFRLGKRNQGSQR